MNLLNEFKDKRIYCCVDSDLDGVGTRVIIEYYIKPIVESFYITNTADRKMTEFNNDYADNSDIILFADIAPTKELLEKLYEDKKEVYIFDHHISSYEAIVGTMIPENYYFSTEKCGTKIIFDALTEGTRLKKVVYQFVELVNCYDLWNDISISWVPAKRLHHTLMESIEWFNSDPTYDRCKKFVDLQLQKFRLAKNFHLTKYEELLAIKGEKKEQTNYEQAKKTMSIRTDNSMQKYAYCECNSKMSLVCSRLMKEYPDIDYFAMHSVFLEQSKGELNGRLSLRSNSDTNVNVAAIAELHKGGGHNNAAGCELELEDFEKFKKGKLHLI